MRKHLLKIAWGCLLASVALAFLGALAAQDRLRAPFLALDLFFVAALLAFAFLTVRAYRFIRGIDRFIRQLLAGNYHARILESARTGDEMNRIEKLMNKLGDQLHAYDELREDRVRVCSRVTDLVFTNVQNAILSIDMDKGRMRLNPPARKLFRLAEEDTLSLESISRLKENGEFMDLLGQAARIRRSTVTGRVMLHVPARNVKKLLAVEMIPIKDKDETVRTVLVFVQAVRPEKAAPDPERARPGSPPSPS